MNLQEVSAAMEKMSEEDLQAILDTEIDADLEKEASDEVAQAELENALYAYGMFKADLEVESEEAGDEGLSKEASAEFENAEKEISEAIETGVAELGLDDIEDDGELHKTAMAAATLIFEGYTDQLEKWAAKSKKGGKGLKGMMGAMKKKLGKGLDAAKKHGGKAMASAKKHGGKALQMAKKHPGKAGLLAAGAAAAGYGVKKHMDKKASELSTAEIIDLTLEKQATLNIIGDGLEKLAARGAAKGGMLAKGLAHAKGMAKKHGKHMAGAAAGAGAAGYLAGRMQKKD